MKCSFCQEIIKKGTGKIYVKKTGKILYFCSMKCEKNLNKLGHKPLTTRWTGEFADAKAGGKK
jgi:large subunit ribosomal protein L24e